MTNCQICEVESEEEHRRLEAAKIINHQFSRDGQLHTVEKPGGGSPKPRHEVLVVPGVDLPLRTLLIEKGILSAQDFDDAGFVPGFASSDRAPGAQPGTEGSLRTAPEHS